MREKKKNILLTSYIKDLEEEDAQNSEGERERDVTADGHFLTDRPAGRLPREMGKALCHSIGAYL